MPNIHHLSTRQIAQIAAGEVIERPSMVVKELLENALDAGATQIRISLKQGGLTAISISDDGHGMNQDDLELSVERYTTSKLQPEDSVYQVTSLGFRGEALFSIGSISEMIIETRSQTSSIGHQLHVGFGQKIAPQPIGMSPGTTVTVMNLFKFTPVRKRFLKSPAVELRLCVEVVTLLAIAHPEVGFHLVHNTDVILQLPARQTFQQRIASVMGGEFMNQLVPFSSGNGSSRIYGYLGHTNLARKTTSKQLLFVNQRPVYHSLISKTIKQGYGTLLPNHLHPAFILFVEVPPSEVDPNIHPRKESVALSQEDDISTQLLRDVNHLLNPIDYSQLPPPRPLQLRDDSPSLFQQAVKSTFGTLKQLLNSSDTPKRPPLQYQNTYLVWESEEGLVIVDQHAADERIVFEKLYQILEKSDLYQPVVLDTSVTFELEPVEQLDLAKVIPHLQKLGYEIEPFGNNSFKITQVPQILKDHPHVQVIREVLDDVRQNIPVALDTFSHQTIAYLACRSAIKAGDSLTEHQRLELVSQLFATSNHHTCPHGRPTYLTISWKELEQRFKRR